MQLVFLAHVGVFALAAVGCLVSVPRALEIRHPRTRQGMVGLLLSVTLWAGGYVGYLLAPSDWLRAAFYTLGFVFAFVAVAAWFFFCAAYTGRPPERMPYRRLLVGAFLALTALKLFNPYHHLYFTTAWTVEPFPHLAINHGLLYWIVLGLSYAVTAVGFFMLVERFEQTGADSQPLLVLAVVTAVPAVATVIGEQVDWLLPLMYEPPGVAVFSIGTLFVYFRRFEAVQLTGERAEPSVFLDRDGLVRDYNRAAESLFPALAGSVGEPIESTVAPLASRVDDPGVVSVDDDGDGDRYFQIASTAFTSGGVTTGRLVTLTDVTERERYRRRLEEKTEQLEALNRVVRHDIRNDMAVINGWAGTLHEHVDEEGDEALERVLRKSEHVIELTETVRDFVESLSGEAVFEPEPTDLHRHLDTEVAATRETFPEATIRVDGDLPTVTVLASEMLSSVFRNLLENAVRHNDSDAPEVTVSAVDAGDTVRVRIADNGPGVPDEQKETVFGKGEKGLDSPGSGIGLYLVHTLTEGFGGRVWIEDNEPRGAVFVVELPKADDA
ncbi:histidine kinase N-terminal 7TM domain-containing protein [Halolamina litorea]|uniref:histidine kinase n=1 Tax=Halolamina litorea TaxID=1515593 RepID=A0ABD6BPP9_9EURY|nr:ATP-binding protein [Halolamina litorea]